jgi:predicted ATP-dependent endonuclease of OLD family
MLIRSIKLQNYRSLRNVSVDGCAGLNVIIGKNNSGKSNILSGIEFAFDHLRTGRVAAAWSTRGRPTDEFTNRDCESPIQVGLEFKISAEQNSEFREILSNEIIGLDETIEELERYDQITYIVGGTVVDGNPYRYIQEIAFGSSGFEDGRLVAVGSRLFSVPDAAISDVINSEKNAAALASEIAAIDQILSDPSNFDPRREMTYSVRRILDESARPEIARQVEQIFRENSPQTDANERLTALKKELESRASSLASSELASSLLAFAGATKRTPNYVSTFLQKISESQLLYFRETRPPIGPEEAAQLLRLKTTRGGPQQLTAFQKTVKDLLGVSVDAFEAEPITNRLRRVLRRPQAEIDIDQFLVEANGAGIREAIRILLDLELRKPAITLIEEPEVHLHPGLEKVIHRYLVEKSGNTQVFLATHSTNFLDVTSRQNIYVASRGPDNLTTVKRVVSDAELLEIPGEIGLRPSTVFMFDRLVFVEGKTDEAILRQFAKAADIDLAAQNIGFVGMGGTNNFGHFASEATLDLLSRRQIPLWFVLDRDERDDEDVQKIKTRLGDRAKLATLSRRELENYLLVPAALHHVIQDKLRHTKQVAEVSVQIIEKYLKEIVESCRDRVVELRVNKEILKPIFLDRFSGETSARLERALVEIQNRKDRAQSVFDSVTEDVGKKWDRLGETLIPGTELLQLLFKKFGLSYAKADGERIAQAMLRHQIDTEIINLVREIGS